MIRALLASLALTIPLSAPAAHLPTHRVARPPVSDWTHAVALTPEGGVRMGNPAARVRLVEFSSFTCPHCAAFASEGLPALAEAAPGGEGKEGSSTRRTRAGP